MPVDPVEFNSEVVFWYPNVKFLGRDDGAGVGFKWDSKGSKMCLDFLLRGRVIVATPRTTVGTPYVIVKALLKLAMIGTDYSGGRSSVNRGKPCCSHSGRHE